MFFLFQSNASPFFEDYFSDLVEHFRDSSLKVKRGLLDYMNVWDAAHKELEAKIEEIKAQNPEFGSVHEEYTTLHDTTKVRNCLNFNLYNFDFDWDTEECVFHTPSLVKILIVR